MSLFLFPAFITTYTHIYHTFGKYTNKNFKKCIKYCYVFHLHKNFALYIIKFYKYFKEF